MKFIYPAVFQKTEQGFHGYFPDLEGCVSDGDSLDEAIDRANEAAFEWISVELQEEEPDLPAVTDPQDLELAVDDVVRNIAVTIRFYEGWDE